MVLVVCLKYAINSIALGFQSYEIRSFITVSIFSMLDQYIMTYNYVMSNDPGTSQLEAWKTHILCRPKGGEIFGFFSTLIPIFRSIFPPIFYMINWYQY